jgi:hypothetical protein
MRLGRGVDGQAYWYVGGVANRRARDDMNGLRVRPAHRQLAKTRERS